MRINTMTSIMSYTMNVEEIDNVKKLFSAMMFTSSAFNTKLELTKDINLQGPVSRDIFSWKNIEFNSDISKYESEIPITFTFYNSTKDIDKDNGNVFVNTEKVYLNEDGTPKSFDYGMIAANIISFSEILSTESKSAKNLIPASAIKVFHVKAFDKIYTAYRYFTDKKGNPLVKTEVQKYANTKDLIVEEFVKLETIAELDKNDKTPMIPFSGKYIVFGKGTMQHIPYIIADEKDLKSVIGTDPYTSTSSMWDMCNNYQIIPIYVSNPSANTKILMFDSFALIQRIIAENKINKNFSPTGIIVAR